MTKFNAILSAVCLGAGIVLVGVAIGWLGSRGGPSPVPPLAQPDSVPASPLKFAKGRPEPLAATVGAVPNVIPTNAAETNRVVDWEDRLERILGAEDLESDKARQLLELFPNLPEDGQVEVAQHLSNLVQDQDYAPLGNLLTNSASSEAVLDVLMADLLNRPNSLKLPLLLAVARDPQNPKASEAKDLLELFLEDNFDQDWGKWQARMEQWLRDNPD